MISLIKWSPNYKESTNIKLKVIKTIANEEENVMDFIESKFGAKQRKRMFMNHESFPILYLVNKINNITKIEPKSYL